MSIGAQLSAFTSGEVDVAEIAAKCCAKPAAKAMRKSAVRRAKRDQRGSYAQRLLRNLRCRQDVMEKLSAIGLDDQTVAAVGLGLKEPYTRADGQIVSEVLVYPVSADGGRTRYGSLNLDGITVNPEHPVGWTTGQSRSLGMGTGELVVVCGSAIEAWLVWQASSAARIDVTALAATDPDNAPEEWRDPAFWSGWSRVVLTDGVSRSILVAVSAQLARPLERCPSAPTVGSDVEIAQELEDWIRMIDAGASSLKGEDPPSNSPLVPGDYAIGRVPIHGGLHCGKMLYAFPVERRERTASSSPIVYSYRTMVVRSDGTVLEPVILPAPAGTPAERRVHALSDGTRIGASPAMPSNATWSLPAIQRFVARMHAKEPYSGPSGLKLHSSLTAHLNSLIWLPDEAQHGLITSFVMATYFHRLFQAFPLLYLKGPKGSGKSELSAAVVGSAFNGTIMSQGSAAALVRLVRESGGLVAIDDAEALTAGFSELVQVLKVGYKASTANKRIVGIGGVTDSVDFFGPRLLCNTRGLDDILASRCIEIMMKPLPAELALPTCDYIDLAEWRDNMHEFAMSYAEDLAKIVAAGRKAIASRADELTFPLTALRKLIGLDLL